MTRARKRPSESPYMTVPECAAFLGVCRSTIYRLLRAGRLPAFKIAADWRFDKRVLTEWMERRTIGAGRGSSGPGHPA